jgi:hypothetical protein
MLVKIPTLVLSSRYNPFVKSPLSWDHHQIYDPVTDQAAWNPLPWSNQPVTHEEVRDKIERGHLRHYDQGRNAGFLSYIRIGDKIIPKSKPSDSRDQHLERIAYFVVHGCPFRIHLKVNPPDWKMGDGFHRLAAAIYRKESWMSVELDWDHYKISDEELLWVRTELQAEVITPTC